MYKEVFQLSLNVTEPVRSHAGLDLYAVRASDIPEPVRRLAQHPMRELPTPPNFQKIEVAGVMVLMTPFPIAQCVEPLGVNLAGVSQAVESAREVAREHDKSILVWWIAPEHDHLVPGLEELGLRHEDTPGFEAVENAMALVSPPTFQRDESVEVKEVSSFEEYAAAARVGMDAFEMTPSMREQVEAGLPKQYEESRHPDNPGHGFVALIDGRVVGGSTAVLGDAGVNLFGGSVHPDARGRGVYRAMTLARWDFAVEHGTPALTVQAGRMSKPIVERLGFEFVAPVRLYVDTVS